MGENPETGSEIRKILERVILVIGFGLMFASLFMGTTVRNGIAVALDTILGPVFRSMPFYMDVLVIALIVSICSNLVQKYTVDQTLIRRVTDANKAFQKEYREAQLSNNKHKIKKLEEERTGMLQDQTNMSKQQMKPLAYVTLISFPLFIWAWWFAVSTNLTMIFPFYGTIHFAQVHWILQYWLIWSILCSLSLAQIVRKAFNVGA
jgi:uncharacterized membrane protein (DUF106 family)